jgi:zinc protease
MWGEHPYAVDLPQPDAVAAVTPSQLRSLHEKLVRPAEAVLILVGDLPTRRLLDTAASTLDAWAEKAKSQKVPSLPKPSGGPLLVVDRPGSVQTSVRFGRPGLARTDPDYPALQLANLIFGGYFSSRWTENIREDKGYTYGPHSRVEHHVLGSTLGLDAEVATGKLASLPVTQDEVDAVRQYAIGTLALSTATQAGLASTLSALSAFGLGVEWIAEHPARLLQCTVDDVSAAAARFFGPAGFTSVVVGDAQTIAGPLASLGAIEQ